MAAQDNIILRTDGSVPTPEEEIERQRHTTRFDAVAIVAGAVCLGGLFYAISTNLYPFLFVLTIALILFPLREYRSARIFLSTSAVLFGLWMLTTLAGILF